MASGSGVAVFHAVFNIAADDYLYRIGHWHGAQAKRTHQQLRQSVWTFLGAGICVGQFDIGLQRLVVHADFGLLGRQHQLVCLTEYSQNLDRLACF